MFTISLSFKRTRDKDRFHEAHTKQRGNTLIVGRVYGDSVAQIRSRSLAEARKVFGKDADLAVVSPFTVQHNASTREGAKPYFADVSVREILPVEKS